MTFKKDYINYLLYTIVNLNESEFKDNYRLRKLVDSIISMDNVMKITYLVGKTAGLEILFKYLLYISDKIDKSQITIFNLKDNFDYDIINLTKICAKISHYKSENVQEAIKNITEEAVQEELQEEIDETDESTEAKDTADIEDEELVEPSDDESDEGQDGSKLTLIENVESYTGEAEVFELESISESVENSNTEEKQEAKDESITDEDTGDEETETTDEISEEEVSRGAEVFELESLDDDLTDDKEETAVETEETVIENNGKMSEDGQFPDVEIEVHKAGGSEEEHLKEEPITNEAYYKFESKFFEEVKILEKLFGSVDKDCRADSSGKLSEKCLQCLTEIIEITSELSNLSRQLSFDLIADIFFTMNIYFTKAISQSEILTSERIKLLDSSLALVNSLIKGEDYLNYDTIVDRIEKLKTDISGIHEAELSEEKSEIATQEFEATVVLEKTGEETHKEPEPVEEAQPVMKIERPAVKQSQMDSAIFKLKYLVKEFEKSFMSINSLKGEYSKFEALEKIGELNNALRLIAKISSAVRLYDLLKLAEVTYVFLKYVKDYRMDLLEPEIQQIVKYIIFTFKMLLTSRKPEDFNVLVQHLNNPVKIFADS